MRWPPRLHSCFIHSVFHFLRWNEETELNSTLPSVIRHEINQSFIQLHEWIGLIWLQLPPCALASRFTVPCFACCAFIPQLIEINAGIEAPFHHSVLFSFQSLSFHSPFVPLVAFHSWLLSLIHFHSFKLISVTLTSVNQSFVSSNHTIVFHSVALLGPLRHQLSFRQWIL